MAVCPGCGDVPALTPSQLCCKINKWLLNVINQAEADIYYELLEAGDPETLAFAAENKERQRRHEACRDSDDDEDDRVSSEHHERQLQGLYGVQVVRQAREAQKAWDAEWERSRRDRGPETA
jgi:hypothetical protein